MAAVIRHFLPLAALFTSAPAPDARASFSVEFAQLDAGRLYAHTSSRKWRMHFNSNVRKPLLVQQSAMIERWPTLLTGGHGNHRAKMAWAQAPNVKIQCSFDGAFSRSCFWPRNGWNAG